METPDSLTPLHIAHTQQSSDHCHLHEIISLQKAHSLTQKQIPTYVTYLTVSPPHAAHPHLHLDSTARCPRSPAKQGHYYKVT